MDSVRKNRRGYAIHLLAGFLGLCLPNLLHFSGGFGISTAIWILAFLFLTIRYDSKREKAINSIVFLVGYFLRFFNSMDSGILFSLLYLIAGLIQYLIFEAYARLIRRWNRWYVTLAFPVLWMLVYLFATLLRCPSLIRVDSMFADLNVLLQAEDYIGSFGLSFFLLWIFSLLVYAACNRRILPAVFSAALGFSLLLIGMVHLYPNVSETESVRVALCTGPYVGNYVDYIELPLERDLAGMRSCVAEAARQGAEIIAFNEESYELSDQEESFFLSECCRSARENGIHMLVCEDLRDTDGSEGGKSVNKAVWIDQNGEILGSYRKAKTIPILESDYVRGEAVIPSHSIRVGDREIKVSYLICYDSNFPMYVDEMDDDTDILFLPSWDWAAVAEMHARITRTLAVENRVSVVKPTYDGFNIALRADGVIIESMNTNELGYEQVQLIDVPVNGERGLSLQIMQGENYVHSIIAAEVLSILFGLVMLYGNRFEKREKTPRNRLYSITVIACVLATAADAVSWIFDGCERLESILYLSTAISMIGTFVLDTVFLFYIAAYARESAPVSDRLPRIGMYITAAVSLLILATSGSGLLFGFEKGIYHEGPFYSAYIVLNLLCTLFCLYAILKLMKSRSVHDRVAIASFLVLPLLEGIINLFVEHFSYAYPAIMVSLAVLYTMIQSERADRLEREGVASDYRAQHDALTGLLNRLAYEVRLKELAVSEGSAAAIFTDVNGLKMTNDNLGHEAGDALLVRYANLLCSLFRKEEVYRISGDEFTVLLDNMEESAVQRRLADFRELVNENGIPLASIGLACGEAKDVNALIRMAETEMYREKQEFHRLHPETER